MSDKEPISLVDLLNKPLSDFPDLPSLPGRKWFYGKLTGEITADHAKNDRATPFYHLGLRITDPGKDVTPNDLKPITDGGFNLADYEAGADFYITPKALPMLRRLLSSLGFPDNTSFVEALKLDSETGNPTEATSEVLRGRDVIFRTPAANPDSGRVYLGNVEMLSGKADGS